MRTLYSTLTLKVCIASVILGRTQGLEMSREISVTIYSFPVQMVRADVGDF